MINCYVNCLVLVWLIVFVWCCWCSLFGLWVFVDQLFGLRVAHLLRLKQWLFVIVVDCTCWFTIGLFGLFILRIVIFYWLIVLLVVGWYMLSFLISGCLLLCLLCAVWVCFAVFVCVAFIYILVDFGRCLFTLFAICGCFEVLWFVF